MIQIRMADNLSLSAAMVKYFSMKSYRGFCYHLLQVPPRAQEVVPMFTVRIRIVTALGAFALVVAACYLLAQTKRPIGAVLFAPAAVLALPLFASNRPPRREEWTSLNENVARFRTAGLVCFTIAVMINAAPANNSIAALGVAWWAVGFGMIPFALYFASRRAMLEDDSTD